ncbi:MAG: cytochrome b/b6 domain-containing protein [Burkholderiaceae bacterium]
MREQTMPEAALPGIAMPHAAVIHPLWLRINHWINAIAVLVMVTSGWRIYNASPIFPFRFPKEITLGGWLGGAIQWHFAAMWLLAINGAVYLLMNLATGRFRRKFLPLHPRGVLQDLRAALAGHLAHDDLAHYNMVQKAAYTGVIAALIVVLLSGLAVWKSVQFPLLRDLMGGFDNARVVHFCAMAVIVAFVAVHLAMVALVPRTLLAMLRGR